MIKEITYIKTLDRVNHILNNSIWFIFDDDVVDYNYMVEAIKKFVWTKREECQIDILGRLYTEYEYGDEGKRVRVTRAHYANGRYIISTHEKGN